MKVRDLLYTITFILGCSASFTCILFGVWLLPQFLEFAIDFQTYNVIRWILPIGILGAGVMGMLGAFFLSYELFGKEKKEVERLIR